MRPDLAFDAPAGPDPPHDRTPGRVRDDRYPAVAALAVGAVLQWSVTDAYSLTRPGWLLPVLELALVAVLLITGVRGDRRHTSRRWLRLGLVALLTFDTAASAALLNASILTGSPHSGDAATLLQSAAAIYATNIISCSVWYWELDRGGPLARLTKAGLPDFCFPQMTLSHAAAPDWRPTYLDYLYLSLTNAAAFSPTDTLPLTHRAKALMALQSLISLTTILLVVARAISLLH